MTRTHESMSKFIIFDFRCTTCDHRFEQMVKPDVHDFPCEKCGSQSKRLISAPRIDPRLGINPDFPGAYGKWEKTQRQKRQIEKKYYDNHGVDLTYGGDVKP